ncbi:MAG: hypothetical protein AAGJ74_07640 [Pseudomonadota bacterium]
MIKAILSLALALVMPPALVAAQKSYTAQEIANMSGRVYNREVRREVVQGPTMTRKDVGPDGIGYAIWGYKDGDAEVFRLVALMGTDRIDVNSIGFEGFSGRPQFSIPKGTGNIQIDFSRAIYDHGWRNGLTVTLVGQETRSFTVPKEYFQGHRAWWRATYQ